jgi:hypothetical protein
MLFQEIYVKIDINSYKSLVMNTSFKEFIVIICALLYVSKGIKHVDSECRTE